MSIQSKHYYRFEYLKSEEWQTVRIEALVRFNATCYLCHHRDLSNDAHHIFYEGNFWKTKAKDLVVLCRNCHGLVHSLLSIRSISKTRKEKLIEFKQFSKCLTEWKENFCKERLFEDFEDFKNSSGALELKHIKTPKIHLTKCFCCHSLSKPVAEKIHKKFIKQQLWCDECWIEIGSVSGDMKWSELRVLINSKRDIIEADADFKAWYPAI